MISRRYRLLFWMVIVVLLVAPATVRGQEAAAFFRQNCMSCHTIGGGRLTGPDLRNVHQRRDRDWLVRFLLNPRSMIESGDAYARQIYEDSRRVVMPAVSGMTAERAAALLSLIETESAAGDSQFKGLQISDRPFSSADIALGRAIFRGNRKLANRGSACLACHTVRGLDSLSGGRLGPDLTRAYERLGGRKNMGAWLFAPATPTMSPLFGGHPLEQDEILALLAFFENTAKQGGEDDTVALLNFFFLSLGGMILTLAVFDAIWKGRFRGVRAALVERRGAAR